MKKNILYFLLFLSHISYSQISFDPEQVLFEKNLYSHSLIESLFIADINQDSDKDIISLSYSTSSQKVIAWYENVENDFLYNHPKEILEDAHISNLFIVDVNGDYKNDIIITSNYGNDKLYWVENLGNGSFSDENIISGIIDHPRILYSNDIDNDGDFDILVDNDDDEILLFENTGNGVFSPAQVIYSGSYSVNKIISEDINNDGLLDIVSGHYDGSIYWAENFGNNVFSDRRLITGGADDGTSIGFLDINSDGFKDLVTSSNYDDDVKYYLNQSGVSFDDKIIIDDTQEDPYELKILDMDNDGLEDIIISFWTNDKIGWYKNLGNESWSALSIVVDNINNPKVFLLEDFDNDTHYDIVSTSRLVNYVGENKLSHYYFDTANNSYSENKLIFPHGTPKVVKITDINNDNYNDIVTCSSSYLLLNKNKGNGNFTNRKIISDNLYYDFETVDINNDGFIDIVAGGDSTDIFLNQGNEIFNLIYSIPLSAHYVEASDINNDNYIDILISHSNNIDNSTDIYKVFNQNGSTFSTAFLVYSTFGDYYMNCNIKCGDMDIDGDIDIIFNTINNYDIHRLNNDGSGTFSYEFVEDTGVSESLELEDLNNDGYLDIITGYGDVYSSYSFYWLQNLSGTGFTDPIVIDNDLCVESIDFADLNNDGYKDIIVTNLRSHSENIYCIINNNTNFEYRVLLAALQDTYSAKRDLDLGFLNNDNKIDIVTSFSLRYKVGIFNNSSVLGTEGIMYSSQKDLDIYPNPFKNELYFRDELNQKFFISIFNIHGEKIYDLKEKVDEASLDFLDDGIFFIHLSNEDYSFNRKIIKQSKK